MAVDADMIILTIVLLLAGVAGIVAGAAGIARSCRRGILRPRDLAAAGGGLGLVGVAALGAAVDRPLTGVALAVLAAVALAAGVVIRRLRRVEASTATLVDDLAVRTPLVDFPAGGPFVAVVVPAFNEAAALPGVLARVPDRACGLAVRTIVVSDASTDGTPAVAARDADAVLHRTLRGGSGAAVRTGIAYATRRGAVVAVTVDADGQHDPADVPRLVAPILDGDADVVNGVRDGNTAAVTGSTSRVLGIAFFGWAFRTVLGLRTADPASGFRAIRIDACRRLGLVEDQFYVGELLVRAHQERLVTVDVPVTMSPRTHGESKKPMSLAYGLGFARGIVRAMLTPAARGR